MRTAVLLLAARTADVRRVEAALHGLPEPPSLMPVATADAARRELAARHYDCVLAVGTPLTAPGAPVVTPAGDEDLGAWAVAAVRRARRDEGTLVLSATGRVREADAVAARILGTGPDALRAGARVTLVREDGTPLPPAEHPAAVAARTGATLHGVVVGVDRGNGRRWVEVDVAPLRRPDEPRPYGAVAWLRDVTDHRRTTAELLLRDALIDAAGEAIVATAPDGTVLYWNTAAEVMYGWLAAEVMGRRLPDVPGLAPLGAEEWSGDADIRRHDGSVLSARVTEKPLRDATGRVVALARVAIDVSRWREAEDVADRLSAIIDSSGDAIIGRALDGTVTSWNPAAERLTGYTAADALGRHASFMTPPDRHAHIRERLARVERGEAVAPYDQVVIRKDGTVMHMSMTISPIRDHTGVIVGSSAIAKDITDQVRLRAAAEDDRRRLAEAQSIAGLGSFEHRSDGSFAWSDELYRIFGLEPGAPIGETTLMELVHPDDHAVMWESRMAVEETDQPVDFGYRVVRRDGQTRHVVCRVHSAPDPLGGMRLVGTVLDVTDREQADARRRAAERRFELGFETAAAGTAIVDTDGRLLRVNAALCRILGRTDTELIGRNPDEFVDPARTVEETPFAAAVAGNSSGAELRFVRADGALVDAIVDVAVVRGDGGEPDYLFAQVLDITRRKDAERALEHQALHDTLTGLPNRALLLDRLDHALVQRGKRGSVAVVLVDLDQFKLVNDGLGHFAGDALLIEAAARLVGAVRPGDTVCRLGGDEFVVCCEEVDGAEGALRVADRIGAAFAKPFVIERRELFVTASVGVTVSSPGMTADALLRDADAAMYRAKERGRARVELFDESLHERATARLATAASLRRALENDEIVVHYQPVVSVADDRLVGFEALVRWNDPERGLVPPSEFIPVAEETGLIVPLGTEVLRQATTQLAVWSRTFSGAGDVTMAVNVSARQLADPALVTTVAAAIAESGIAPGRLHLEITETVLMEDVEESIEALRALAGLGVTLEIDDFGTGYSSLSYLKRLPVDTLKVDRSFVAGLGTSQDDTSIVEAIAAMAHAMSLRLHAEGVETEEQRAAVKAIGFEVAQGYHWSPPLPAEAAERWLRRRAIHAVPHQRSLDHEVVAS